MSITTNKTEQATVLAASKNKLIITEKPITDVTTRRECITKFCSILQNFTQF